MFNRTNTYPQTRPLRDRKVIINYDGMVYYGVSEYTKECGVVVRLTNGSIDNNTLLDSNHSFIWAYDVSR